MGIGHPVSGIGHLFLVIFSGNRSPSHIRIFLGNRSPSQKEIGYPTSGIGHLFLVIFNGISHIENIFGESVTQFNGNRLPWLVIGYPVPGIFNRKPVA